MRAFALALAALSLAACAAVPEPDQIAQGHMIGLSGRQIRACLGPPLARRAVAEATEIWTYPGVTATHDPPWAAGLDLAAARGPEACDVQIVLTNGAVTRIVYVLADGRPLPSGRQCSFPAALCASGTAR